MNTSGIAAKESAAQPLLRTLRTYGTAVLAVAVALGLALFLQHLQFRDIAVPLLLFAIAIASWYGGRGPAALAAILSISSFYWYFVEPVRTIEIYPSQIPYFIVFAAFASLLSWFATTRRRAEAVLRERANLLDLTHDTVFVMDMEGVIRYWNRGAEERYGWTAEQATGRVVHDLLKTVPPTPIELIKGEVTRNGRWEGELVHTGKDGTPIVVASRWSLQRDERGAPVGILETNNNITERKQAEEALHRLNRELRAISNCNQILLRATDEQSLLEQICRVVCEEAGYPMAWVSWVEHDEAKSVRPVAWAGTDEAYLENAGITWSEETERGRGPTGTCIRSGKTCSIQDFAADPRAAPWRVFLLQHGFRSAIALPLKDEHANVFGTLTIHSERPNAWTAEETRLLEELAGDLAFGVMTLRSQAARKQAEQANTLLTFALDNTRDVALLSDDKGHFQYVNNEACRVLGYTGVDLLGMAVPDIDLEIPAERWPERWLELKARRTLNSESRYRTRNGRIFPVEISVTYLEHAGRPYCLAFARDITERKRAEDELRNSEAELARERDRLRLLLEINNHIVSKMEPKELFRAVAQSMRSHFGADLTSFLILNNETGILERKFLDFPGSRGFLENAAAVLPSKLLTEWWLLGRPVVYSPPEADLPQALRDADRAESILSAVSVPLTGTGGPVGLFNVASQKADAFSEAEAELLFQIGTQISLVLDKALAYDRLRISRDELQRSEAYLEDAQRLSHSGGFAFDVATNKAVYVSEELCRIFELDPKAGIWEPVSRYVHPEDRDRVQRDLEKTLREKVDTSTEFRVVLPSGTRKHIQAIRHPVLNETGDVVTIVGTAIDITERKHAEEERERLRQLESDLAHLNRVSMMGELAASIAHEVNQPLSGIVSNASAGLRWLAGEAPNVEEVREGLRRIVRDGKRAGEVIARIRALTRRTAAAPEKLDPNEIIQEVLALVGDESKKKGVTIHTRFADDLAPIPGDRVQLQQVVLNLVINAIEAMSSIDERARELVITTSNIEPDRVQVTVEDSGIGIDPETLEKIFDSFYTTKPGGMGMGLSISRSILQSHGGRVWAARKDGCGTMFHFTLPKYKEEELHAEAARL